MLKNIKESYKSFYAFYQGKDIFKIGRLNSALLSIKDSVFLSNCLFIRLEDGFKIYEPGSFDSEGVFYPHPINLDDEVLLLSILEKDYNGKEYHQFSAREQEEYRKGPGIEIKLRIRNNGIPVSHSLNLKYYHDIERAIQVLYYFVFYIKQGLRVDELNEEDFVDRCLTNYSLAYTYENVFTFVNELKFYSWSEVFSRVGKDNRIEEGGIIRNVPKNKYLIKVITKNTRFAIYREDALFSPTESSYAYIRSSPYKEVELDKFESHKLKQEILGCLIKYYDAKLDFIHSFVK